MTQQRVYFNSRDKLIRLDIQKIVYFEGDGNYTYIVTANKQKVCVTMNLSHTEEALAAQLGDNAKQFMRIGKRFIVNMNYIYQVDIQRQTLMLSDCEHFLFQMPVSKEALKTVKELVIRTKIWFVMEIIIGRDQQTRQLCIVKDGNCKLYGQPGSVPMDVSRHHISLQPVGTGKWQIKNLNERNVTFVNGIAI